MTDQEAAAVLRRLSSGLKLDPFEWAAINRAIAVLTETWDHDDVDKHNDEVFRVWNRANPA